MKHHRLISRRPLLASEDTGTDTTTDTTDTGGSGSTVDAPFSGSNFAYFKNFMINSTDQMIQWIFRKSI